MFQLFATLFNGLFLHLVQCYFLYNIISILTKGQEHSIFYKNMILLYDSLFRIISNQFFCSYHHVHPSSWFYVSPVFIIFIFLSMWSFILKPSIQRAVNWILYWLFSACISELTSFGQAKCSNESEAIHHPRSKYEVSHVIRTWQKVREALQVWQMTAC